VLEGLGKSRGTAVSNLPALTFLNLYACCEVSATGINLLKSTTASPDLKDIWLDSYVDEAELLKIVEEDGGLNYDY
jgi:hypothetical protein